MLDAATGNQIRVYIPYTVLWAFDQSQLRDVYSAIGIMKDNRQHFESLASTPFDELGPTDGDNYQGQPVVTLKS
jgi:hypothetical protein